MIYSSDLFHQDLKAARNTLEKEEPENLNIAANRILSNSYIFNDNTYCLFGIILKDIASTLLSLKYSKNVKAISTTRALTAGFFKKIWDMSVTKDFTSIRIWQEYNEFNNSIRSFLMNEFEDGVYDEDKPNITHEAILFLLDILKRDKEKLLNPRCLVLKGVLNEMSRMAKSYGIGLQDEFSFALISSLDRCYDYVSRLFEGNDFINEVNSVILTHLTIILDILEESGKREDKWIPSIDEELYILTNQWRHYYLLFMETSEISVQERAIRLPSESRKKLTEAITRTLEEELPRKNR